jgi:hypothetical protein
MRRFVLACGLIVPLAGCGLPTPLSVASLVFDVGSYALTGKTTTDHAISAVAGEDCAAIRVLEGDPCQSPEDYELALGVLEPLPDEEIAAAPLEPVDLQSSQTAALGLQDVEPRIDFVALAAPAFLADDAAPGMALAADPPAELGAIGFLSDDLRPDRTALPATQLGRAGVPVPSGRSLIDG